MAWLAVNKDGSEVVCNDDCNLIRNKYYDIWESNDTIEVCIPSSCNYYHMDKWNITYLEINKPIKFELFSFRKLMGIELTWEDEPIKI